MPAVMTTLDHDGIEAFLGHKVLIELWALARFPSMAAPPPMALVCVEEKAPERFDKSRIFKQPKYYLTDSCCIEILKFVLE